MIIREHYIKTVREFYDSDLIKIITGIRRCGKSILLGQIMDELREKTDNIVYLNFEDRSVTKQIRSAEDLITYVEGARKEGLCYLFFDEIQEVPDWHLACKTLRLHNCSVFITGSNSRLLSSEFTGELSGRYVSFRVRPFTYQELVEYAKELHKDVSITDYLVWGGFPKRLEFETEEAMTRYLSDLDETIVLNDSLNRYAIRKTALFKNMVDYVLRSNSRIFSAKSIHTYLKQEYGSCSVNTVMKYLGYLEDAYIIDPLKRYSTKTKNELHFYKKIYLADVALNSIRCFDKRYDLTHNFENIVYNELIYRGYELAVYDNKGKEIDFRASKDGKSYYIQAAYSVADEKAYKREFEAFRGADPLSQKILITYDELDYSTSLVRHIKLKDFLLIDEL